MVISEHNFRFFIEGRVPRMVYARKNVDCANCAKRISKGSKKYYYNSEAWRFGKGTNRNAAWGHLCIRCGVFLMTLNKIKLEKVLNGNCS